MLERIRQEPGIDAAGATTFLPVEVGWRMPFQVDGTAPPARPEEATQAQDISVFDGYFESVGAKLSAGRSFAGTDTVTSPGVVVVNETFARRFLKDGAVGAKLHPNVKNIGPLGENLLSGQQFEVIGVVADIRNAPITQPVEPAMYFSARQFPFFSMTLTVRGRDSVTELAAIKAALKEIAPLVPLAQTRTWGDRAHSLTAEPRLLMSVLMFFSGLAALLAAVGVYGLFSWAVAVRRRELAIRLTLGAKPAGIGALVLRQSVLLIAVGLGAGWIIVRLSERAIAGVLFDVGANDMLSTASASAILFAAAIVACAIPALRAARTDPAAALRD
jgi:ABC-type antimicrobial peptide transport system permease subunit